MSGSQWGILVNKAGHFFASERLLASFERLHQRGSLLLWILFLSLCAVWQWDILPTFRGACCFHRQNRSVWREKREGEREWGGGEREKEKE